MKERIDKKNIHKNIQNLHKKEKEKNKYNK